MSRLLQVRLLPAPSYNKQFSLHLFARYKLGSMYMYVSHRYRAVWSTCKACQTWCQKRASDGLKEDGMRCWIKLRLQSHQICKDDKSRTQRCNYIFYKGEQEGEGIPKCLSEPKEESDADSCGSIVVVWNRPSAGFVSEASARGGSALLPSVYAGR